jgi:hypothetical protein
MKTAKAVVLLLGCLFALTCRGDAHDWGVGIMIGGPAAVQGKYWIDRQSAIDGAFSIISKDELYVHFDFLVHDYRAFAKPESGQLPLYFGGGIFLNSRGNKGLRTVAGIEYQFEEYPFDVFLELAPLITLHPDTDIAFTGFIGGRYYWGMTQPKKERS